MIFKKAKSFAIVVLVITLAALSYVVLNSSRSISGGEYLGELVPENFPRYEAAIRTSAIRMILGGVNLAEIRFNPPDQMGKLAPKHAVFHPQGGSVGYFVAPKDSMADGKDGLWLFNIEFNQVDSTADAKRENDLIAFVPGIKKEKCIEVMRGDSIPQLQTDQSSLYKKSMLVEAKSDYVLPKNIGPALDSQKLKGLKTGCFLSYNGREYVYFSIILDN